MRWPLLLTLFVVVAGCGSEPTESRPKELPTSYYIRAGDLWRDQANDICSSKNPDFVRQLMTRSMRVLPFGLAGTERFEDFNATVALRGKGMEAVIRWKAGEAGDGYAAIGSFNPETCAVSDLVVGKGPHPHDPRWKKIGKAE